MTEKAPFWKTTPLARMTQEQWESLCDGCGQCCLHKIEDADTGAVAVTNVACAYLDAETCRCQDYANRAVNVPDCVTLTSDNLHSLYWMPETCAYRLLAEGKDLAWWHPLVSGDPATVIEAGVSVGGTIVSEEAVENMEDHVTGWINRHKPHLKWRHPPKRDS